VGMLIQRGHIKTNGGIMVLWDCKIGKVDNERDLGASPIKIWD